MFLELGEKVTVVMDGERFKGVVIMDDTNASIGSLTKYRVAFSKLGGWSRSRVIEDIIDTWGYEIERGEVLFDVEATIDLPFESVYMTWGMTAEFEKGWDNV